MELFFLTIGNNASKWSISKHFSHPTQIIVVINYQLPLRQGSINARVVEPGIWLFTAKLRSVNCCTFWQKI